MKNVRTNSNPFSMLLVFAGLLSGSGVVSLSASADEVVSDEVIINSPVDETDLPDQIETDVVQLDFSTSLTEAAPVDGPVPQNLKILGSGITVRRHSDVSMAVACVGTPADSAGEPSCNWLRGVEFEKHKDPEWIGPAFHLDEPKKFHAVLNRVYKNKYKIKFLKMNQNSERHTGWLVGSAFGLTGFFFITRLPIPALSAIPALTAISLFGWIPFGLLLIEGIGDKAFHTDLLADLANGITSPIRGIGDAFTPHGTSSMTSQNGWNWLEEPKRVGRKHYARLKEVLSQFQSNL